ncbi:hypothetical protein BD324DRAFT_217041 [Kockovaella imperatae]|uniref:Uncharacterized protein n=1 Tax=Kockovaella imperatae TaxID=4999 RepID=A0A1Y1U6C3_9TREE|nr:hypothetical protein BD324DRAFT_217041 [Kockovaella imperatae]ORX33590.1 hypothetical protein BD324DRAFT_217041 [Kockovaella imperatae]
MPPPSSRLSYPPDNASMFPTSPTASRGTRASSVFPYTLARPPTNYSEASWLAKTSARPHPSNPPLPRRLTPSNTVQGEDPFTDGETPLYARSDWADDATPRADKHQEERQLVRSPSSFRQNQAALIASEFKDGEPSGAGTLWSRSSYAGDMTTSRFTPGPGAKALGGILEEDEEESPAYPAYTQDGPVASPDIMSPLPATPWTAGAAHRRSDSGPNRSSRYSPSRSVSSLPQVVATPILARKHQGQVTPVSEPRPEHIAQRKSTLPSVLDLEHITGGGLSPDAFADRFQQQQVLRHGVPRHSAFPAVPPLPVEEQPGDTNLMTAGAHQRLGRMSVAPARYSTTGRKKGKRKRSLMKSTGSDEHEKSPLRNSLRVSTRSQGWMTNPIVRFYFTWRPFMTAALTLISALLLTISLQNAPSMISPLVKVQAGAFNVSAADPRPVGLGASGWCQLEGDSLTCREYRSGDFVNAGRSYQLPGDSLLPALGELYSALAATTWLLAAYSLTACFLHFYLFFALSVPFSHLIDESHPLDQSARLKVERKLLDEPQVMCERPPYEGYLWVWWAWWAHRKSPVGIVFSMAQGVMGMSSFGAAVGFYKEVADATVASEVALGGGAVLPILVTILCLDPFIASLRWLFHASDSWSTFLHPPEPSAAAIMLPSRGRLEHVRPTSDRSSFFARQPSAVPIMTTYSAAQGFGEVEIPENPGQMDDETRRWLAAYPSDPELVELIASLQSGQENDDFLLSDVGLVYLRPETEDQQALLMLTRLSKKPSMISIKYFIGGPLMYWLN